MISENGSTNATHVEKKEQSIQLIRNVSNDQRFDPENTQHNNNMQQRTHAHRNPRNINTKKTICQLHSETENFNENAWERRQQTETAKYIKSTCNESFV